MNEQWLGVEFDIEPDDEDYSDDEIYQETLDQEDESLGEPEDYLTPEEREELYNES